MRQSRKQIDGAHGSHVTDASHASHGHAADASHAAGSSKPPRKPLNKMVFGIIIALVVLIAVAVACVLMVKKTNERAAVEIQAEQAALAQAEDAKLSSVRLTFSFTGDCTLGTDENFSYGYSLNKKYEDMGPSWFFSNFRSIFEADDCTVVDMEGTLTTSTTRVDKEFAFKGPPEFVSILTEGDVEAATLANNHTSDYGYDSYNDTIATLDSAGIVSCGWDRIAYLTVKGVSVAIIGTYTLDGSDYDVQQMVDNIAIARQNGAQLVIVFAHWGEERAYVPNEYQRYVGHLAIDSGADFVVGCHPHVTQGIETYNGHYIVYSLGNFCFGGNNNPSDKDCYVVQPTFVIEAGVVTVEDLTIIPASVSTQTDINDYCPTPATGSEYDRIMAKINESSAAIASM